MSRAAVASCLLASLVVACGGDDGSATMADARLADSRSIDTVISDCDYTEQSDLANDTSSSGGVTEQTSLTFSSRTVVCGTLDHTHFDGDITVDADSYTLTVAADTDVIVRMIAPGAESIELVGMDIYAPTPLVGAITYYGNHGVVSAHLPAGTFELLPFALASAAITASVPYRLEITTDTPATRCPEVTTGGFTETETSPNTSNDVYAYPMGAPADFTSNGADAPENTSIVIPPAFTNRFTGTSADITAADKYEDTDTYEIATGGGTNELTVRLTWPTTGTDLDWILYEQNTKAGVAFGNSTSTTAGEVKLIAVKPNTTYWLAVSSVVGTTVPATYNATLCGTQFAP